MVGWEHPFATFLTIINYRGDQVEDVLADVGCPKAARHFLLGGVPPPEVQLAQLAHASAVRVAGAYPQRPSVRKRLFMRVQAQWEHIMHTSIVRPALWA